MKVLCTTMTGPVSGESMSASTWLQVDCEYIVVGVLAVPGRRVELQIIGDGDRTPSWWDSEMFMTTDSRVPLSWGALVGDGGVVTLGPARWLVPGFWESYFDREPKAMKAFDDEIALILAGD